MFSCLLFLLFAFFLQCGQQHSPWTAARSRCRGPARGEDPCVVLGPGHSRGCRDSRDRDLSMDSGIQGSSSSCELDILDSSAASTTASSASDAHEDDVDVSDILVEAHKRSILFPSSGDWSRTLS